jgi:hypothetical protein
LSKKEVAGISIIALIQGDRMGLCKIAQNVAQPIFCQNKNEKSPKMLPNRFFLSK